MPDLSVGRGSAFEYQRRETEAEHGMLRKRAQMASIVAIVLARKSENSFAPDAMISGGGRDLLSRALNDVGSGLRLWRLWMLLGWNDILQRYRRSLLGPFWMTASMAIMVVSLGFLYAALFKTPIREFLPFLCVGLLVWNFMSSFLLEGGALFIGSESYIKQVRLPYSVYVFRSSWSKLIIFAHNFIIYFGVLIYFGIWPGLVALLAIPGLMLVTINGALLSLLIGMVSARFRDIPQLDRLAGPNRFLHHSDHVETRTAAASGLHRNPQSVFSNDRTCAGTTVGEHPFNR